MKVKDLIVELMKQNMNADVLLQVSDPSGEYKFISITFGTCITCDVVMSFPKNKTVTTLEKDFAIQAKENYPNPKRCSIENEREVFYFRPTNFEDIP